MRHFAEKLRKLGGGQVPERWQQFAAAELNRASLSSFVMHYMVSKAARSRGRPRKWSPDINAQFIRTIDAVKAELLPGSRNGKVSDRDAIRHWIKTSEPSMSEHELKSQVKWASKLLSRARPPNLRRPKRKKSQNSR